MSALSINPLATQQSNLFTQSTGDGEYERFPREMVVWGLLGRYIALATDIPISSIPLARTSKLLLFLRRTVSLLTTVRPFCADD